MDRVAGVFLSNGVFERNSSRFCLSVVKWVSFYPPAGYVRGMISGGAFEMSSYCFAAHHITTPFRT